MKEIEQALQNNTARFGKRGGARGAMMLVENSSGSGGGSEQLPLLTAASSDFSESPLVGTTANNSHNNSMNMLMSVVAYDASTPTKRRSVAEDVGTDENGDEDQDNEQCNDAGATTTSRVEVEGARLLSMESGDLNSIISATEYRGGSTGVYATLQTIVDLDDEESLHSDANVLGSSNSQQAQLAQQLQQEQYHLQPRTSQSQPPQHSQQQYYQQPQHQQQRTNPQQLQLQHQQPKPPQQRHHHQYGGALRRLPIIGMSANSDDVSKEMALAAGMDNFIGKPFSFKDLQPLLVRIMTSRSGSRA
jgi:CheY-like chemotaxis protein